jgi:hypothetical protein
MANIRMTKFSNIKLGITAMCFVFSCTGVNLITLQNASNTNPTREYAGSSAYFKGGLIFHRNYTPGFVGLNAVGSTESIACNHSVLSLISWGDSSVEKAKIDGKITKVAYVDYLQLGILGGLFYHKFCSLVKGE